MDASTNKKMFKKCRNKSTLNKNNFEKITQNSPYKNKNVNFSLNKNKFANPNNLYNYYNKSPIKNINNKYSNKLPPIANKFINNNTEKKNAPCKIKIIVNNQNINNMNIINNNIKIQNNNNNIKINNNINNIKISKDKNNKNNSPEHIKIGPNHSTEIRFVKVKNTKPNGLINVGEPLCMNAILQCLANINYLTEKILSYDFKANIKSNNNKYQLTRAYAEILENLWMKKNILFSPEKIKNIIYLNNKLIQINRRIEPSVLVIFLIETMHYELNKVTGNNSPSTSRNKFQLNLSDFINSFKNNYSSIISDLFYGGLNNMRVCYQCKNKINNFSCFNALSFPLQKILDSKGALLVKELNIYDCFKYSLNNEFISGNKKCNSCQNFSMFFKLTNILYTPKIMIICLLRENMKYNFKFKLEETINIKDYLFYKESVITNYELVGVVNFCKNFGSNNINGKYIAFCKNFLNQEWFKCYDTSITPSSFLEVSNYGIPCILFYSYILS